MKLIFALSAAATLCFSQSQAQQKDLFSTLVKNVIGETEDDRWATEVTATIDSIYDLMFPENERRQWTNTTADSDKYSITAWKLEAEGNWIPKGQPKLAWSERVNCRVETLKDADKGLTIQGMIDRRKDLIEKNERSVIEMNVLSVTDNSAVVEYSRQLRGTSGIARKDTLERCIEKWIVSGDWKILLAYDVRPALDKGKEENWGKLKENWIKRFNNVSF